MTLVEFGFLHLEDPFAVVVESEVDQSPEIDGGNAQRETELVSLHPSKSDPAMIVSHQPGNRSFHHRSPSSVVLGEVTFLPRTTGFDQFFVVRMETERATAFGSGAPIPEGASVATNSEHGSAALRDENCVTGGTGDGARFLVHYEVLPFEATGHCGLRRPGLDGPLVLGLAQRTERLSRAIGTVAQNLKPGLLLSQQHDAG